MTWTMACWCPHVFGTINDKLSTFYITLNFITDLSMYCSTWSNQENDLVQ